MKAKWLASLAILFFCQATMAASNIKCHTLSAHEIADAIKNKQITAYQCLNDFYQHIDELNYKQDKKLKSNSFITVNRNGGLVQAKALDKKLAQGEIVGPLHGVPIVIKDNISTRTMPTTAGTATLRNFYPKEDAEVVTRLRKAGAIIYAKTNMHELAMGTTSNNYTFGPVRNPHDPEDFAGGSSGGSAAAVYLQQAPIALGTDTSGSVRIPAALTGVIGYRPTVGRYPMQGVIPVSKTLDTVGILATNIDDINLVDAVLQNKQPTPLPKVNLNTLRLGMPTKYFQDKLELDVGNVFNKMVNVLTDHGVTIIKKNIPLLSLVIDEMNHPIVNYEFQRDFGDFLQKNMKMSLQELVPNITSPDVKAGLSAILTKPTSEQAYQRAINSSRPQLQQAFETYFNQNTIQAFIIPTTRLTAREVKGSLETVIFMNLNSPTVETYIHNTFPSAAAGLPSISIPIGTTYLGMPVALELDGPADSDRQLMAIAKAILNLTYT